MAVELVMPRLSESMEEGTIVSWLVADGAPVASGQEIAEIETDKATLPYEAPEGGILRILVPEGTTLPLGSPIGLIDDFVGAVAPVAAPVGAAPGAVDLDPPTESFEIHPDLVQPPAGAGSPHAPHPSQPVASATSGGEWSPAWGPQAPQPPAQPQAPAAPAQPPVPPQQHAAPQPPVGAQPQRPVPPPPLQPPAEAPGHHADEEGETTEFDALDPSLLESAPPAAAEQPPLADPAGNPWLGAPSGPAAGVPVPAAPPATPAAAASVTDDPAPAPEAGAPPPAPLAPAPPAAPESAPSPAAPGDEGRYAADDLIAPPTLAPRPPEQQPAPAAGAPRVIASPVARRLAGELGIDLTTLTGSGPEGRIVRADIEAAQAAGAARPPRPASATPAAASEFTPPVDEARAAAPIPEPEPAPEGEVEAEVEAEVEPAPEAEVEPAATPAPVAEPASQTPEATHDAGEVAEAELEASAEADAAQVVAIAGETAHSIDVDDEADIEAPDPDRPEVELEAAPPEPPVEAELEPEPAAAPAAEARILPAAQPGGGKGEPEVVELTRQQATVARRMAESKATIPDFHTTVELDAGPLLTLRADLIATRPDLAAPSVNDLLVKAVAIALRAFPRLNGAYKDGRIEQYPRINVGIATESAGALVVPVIHDADALSVSQIAARTDEILAKAADGGLRPPDIASATFTVSNLGMHGVDEFTAVITPGQAAILTAGAITERPVVRNGNVVAGQTLRLTLTTDHRAVYGLQAAEFLGRVRQLIEHPSSLLA